MMLVQRGHTRVRTRGGATTVPHASDAIRCLGTRHLPRSRPMTGSPMKRMRKAGVTDPVTGEFVAFPYMPRVAELPPGWRHFTTAQKIEHLIGLDRCRETRKGHRGASANRLVSAKGARGRASKAICHQVPVARGKKTRTRR